MTYPPEVAKKIKELQAEIDALKERCGCVVIEEEKLLIISDLTGAYKEDIKTRISWLTRCVLKDSFYFDNKRNKRIKRFSEFNEKEIELAKSFSSELCNLLIEYAKYSKEVK